jgi:hypothetical protein
MDSGKAQSFAAGVTLFAGKIHTGYMPRISARRFA